MVMQMLEKDKDIIREAARKSVEKFRISLLIDNLEEVMNDDMNKILNHQEIGNIEWNDIWRGK
jgi:predicted component of type VI protein secretion system